jgi:membrane protease YdiL (CAAX protease family)
MGEHGKVPKIPTFVNQMVGTIGAMSTTKKPFVRTSWILISLFVAGIAVLQAIPERKAQEIGEDPAGLVVMQLQSQYLLGVASLTGQKAEIAAQANVLDVGSIGQRQRFMAFMIYFENLEAAKQSSLRLLVDLEQAEIELNEQQASTQEMLDILAEGGVLPEGHPLLSDQLGWFGQLLESNENERAELESTASIKVLIVGSMCMAIFLTGGLGVIGLIFFTIRACSGSMKTGMTPPSIHHGVYAEVFAMWLFVFVALMTAAAVLGHLVAKDNPTISMAFSLVAFFLSLSVLGWAKFRGISFQQIRLDIGWHTGSGLFKEIACGFLGYAMMLPLLGVGIIFTIILVVIQQLFIGGVDSDPFMGTGGGAHPIIVEIANGGWQVRVLIISLAAIAAPIVEETIFRGVLYRQLRTSSKALNHTVSILGSILIVSFLFAAIHPQGWVAIPALMGIAVGMNLMREWRGTVIPSMVVHGLSNALVTSMMLIFLSN